MAAELFAVPSWGDDGDLSSLMASFLTLLPVDEAGASSLDDPFDVEMLAATSARARALCDAQIDLGEGPAWDAYRSSRPVELHLGSAAAAGAWPFFCSTLAAAGVRSVLCLPLTLGTLEVGAVSLYSDTSVVFEPEQIRLAQNLASVLARAIIALSLTRAQSEDHSRDATFARREVHQATGMVFSQTGASIDDALLMIRAHAFATGSSVRDVAAQIVDRTLDFTPDEPSDNGK